MVKTEKTETVAQFLRSHKDIKIAVKTTFDGFKIKSPDLKYELIKFTQYLGLFEFAPKIIKELEMSQDPKIQDSNKRIINMLGQALLNNSFPSFEATLMQDLSFVSFCEESLKSLKTWSRELLWLLTLIFATQNE